MFVGERTLCSISEKSQLPPSRTDIETYKIGESAYEGIRNIYGRSKTEQKQVIDLAGEEVDPGENGTEPGEDRPPF